MSDVTPSTPTVAWKEHDWAELLALMKRRRVVPVIGEELLEVEIDGRKTALYPWIGEQLAERLGVPSGATSLNDVVCTYLSRPDAASSSIYTNLSIIMEDVRPRVAVPTPLRQLAEITDFDLYVTATFDSLMETALHSVRKTEPSTIAYSPGNPQDLPVPRDRSRAAVYHLLGILDVSPSYAVSREDLLEWMYALEAPSRPNILFDELKRSYLLVLGESFSNWLPWFLRLRLDRRLSDNRDAYEYLADNRKADHPDLVFIKNFSKQTKRYEGGAAGFVNELWARWMTNRPAPTARPATEPISMPAEPSRGAIFISYASEDSEAARRLYAGLNASGLDGWFDRTELHGGDAFANKITMNIKRCSYFLPLISRNSTGQHDRFFIKEWNCALDRAKGFLEGQAFIVPIIIDETDINTAVLPDQFRNVHAVRLLGGEATPEFCERMKNLKKARRSTARPLPS